MRKRHLTHAEKKVLRERIILTCGGILLIGIIMALIVGPQSFNGIRLYVAIMNNDVESMKQIIKEDPYIVNANLITRSKPLFMAATRGNLEMVGLLVTNGADVNCRGICKETPLHRAVQCPGCEIVRLLLEAGADIAVCNSRGETPLHTAVIFENKEAAEMLIAAGSSLDAIDHNERTPLKVAVDTRNNEMVSLLKKSGSDAVRDMKSLKSKKKEIQRKASAKAKAEVDKVLNESEDFENVYKAKALEKDLLRGDFEKKYPKEEKQLEEEALKKSRGY